MKRYKETSVKINGTNTPIKSGDMVIKDGNKYRFEECTYQFEVWSLIQDEKLPFQQNWEGGMNTADAIVNRH